PEKKPEPITLKKLVKELLYGTIINDLIDKQKILQGIGSLSLEYKVSYETFIEGLKIIIGQHFLYGWSKYDRDELKKYLIENSLKLGIINQIELLRIEKIAQLSFSTKHSNFISSYRDGGYSEIHRYAPDNTVKIYFTK